MCALGLQQFFTSYSSLHLFLILLKQKGFFFPEIEWKDIIKVDRHFYSGLYERKKKKRKKKTQLIYPMSCPLTQTNNCLWIDLVFAALMYSVYCSWSRSLALARVKGILGFWLTVFLEYPYELTVEEKWHQLYQHVIKKALFPQKMKRALSGQ